MWTSTRRQQDETKELSLIEEVLGMCNLKCVGLKDVMVLNMSSVSLSVTQVMLAIVSKCATYNSQS